MDALNDNSHRTWLAIATDHAALVPTYVMDHTLLEKDAADHLPARSFADDIKRLFPLDTPADTWLSAAYFAKNASTVYSAPALRDYVNAEILKAAEVFGITKDVTAIQKAITNGPTVKQASDASYGWVKRTADGTVVERQYPMFDQEGVKLACAHFVENRHMYPLEMRRPLAKNILKAAAVHEYEFVPDAVRREAGIGMPRRDTLMAELLDRARNVKDAEVSIALANINELVAVLPMSELGPELEKIAEIVEEVDKSTGMDRQYGRKVLAPSDFIFDIDMKVAEALNDETIELNKYLFNLKKLAELDPSVYGEVLGDDFASRISVNGKTDMEKLSNELTSLVRPDRIALERHLETAFA